jgi:hypothetical protein
MHTCTRPRLPPHSAAAGNSTSAGSSYRPFPIVLGSILLPETPLGFYVSACSARVTRGVSLCTVHKTW